MNDERENRKYWIKKSRKIFDFTSADVVVVIVRVAFCRVLVRVLRDVVRVPCALIEFNNHKKLSLVSVQDTLNERLSGCCGFVQV